MFTLSWISPSIQTLFSHPGKLSVLLINTTGASFGINWAIKAKGITARDVPIMKAKSASPTIFGAWWNFSGSCSPKKVISGFTRASHFLQRRGSYFWTAFFQSSIDASALQSKLIQWAEREWPWACKSFSSEIPVLTSKSSIFWVKLQDKIPSSWSFLMNLCPSVGLNYPFKNSFATFRKGAGFFLKYSS